LAAFYNDYLQNLVLLIRNTLIGKSRFFLIGFVLLLGIGYLVSAAFPGNTSYYFTVRELDEFSGEKGGRNFRVKGELVAQSFVRKELDTTAEFMLFEGDHTLRATYSGVVPDLFFDERSEIILQGVYGPDEIFQVETVSVLCPSKYEGLEEEEEP